MDKLPEKNSERLVRLIFGESQAEMPKKPRRPDVQDISELKLRLCDVLESLSERERRVLELRFGLGDGYSKTLEEVGKQFKVTRDRIRQIEAKALRKMRHPTRMRQLQEMIGNKE